MNAVSVSVVDSGKAQARDWAEYGFHFSDDGADIDESGHDVRLGLPILRFKTGLIWGDPSIFGLERTVDKNTESFPEGFTMDFGALILPARNFTSV